MLIIPINKHTLSLVTVLNDDVEPPIPVHEKFPNLDATYLLWDKKGNNVYTKIIHWTEHELLKEDVGHPIFFREQ